MSQGFRWPYSAHPGLPSSLPDPCVIVDVGDSVIADAGGQSTAADFSGAVHSEATIYRRGVAETTWPAAAGLRPYVIDALVTAGVTSITWISESVSGARWSTIGVQPSVAAASMQLPAAMAECVLRGVTPNYIIAGTMTNDLEQGQFVNGDGLTDEAVRQRVNLFSAEYRVPWPNAVWLMTPPCSLEATYTGADNLRSYLTSRVPGNGGAYHLSSLYPSTMGDGKHPDPIAAYPTWASTIVAAMTA